VSDFGAPIDLQVTAALARAKPATPAGKITDADQAAKAAKDFEAVFINEMVGTMFEGIETDGPFGGGPGEAIFRSMMIENYSKTIAAQGGFGLSDVVKRELLHTQENAR
jgi:Rod binding domain-containing protein